MNGYSCLKESEALINSRGDVVQKQEEEDVGEGETRIQTEAIKCQDNRRGRKWSGSATNQVRD